MKKCLTLFLASCLAICGIAQKPTIAQIKANLETATNPVAYARDVLKKQIRLDTIIIMNTSHFGGLADSLAYAGKLKQVYGPYDKKFLVQVLARSPNLFTRISQIFIDTSVFTRRIADSLADNIISRLKAGTVTFEDMAQTYSMGGEGITKGDLGWVARGSILPQMDKEIAKRKKGDVFKFWSKSGVHIIKKTSDPKQDSGFALMMRVVI